MTCFLLHNFIRNELVVDLIDSRLDDQERRTAIPDNPPEFISSVEVTLAWTMHWEVLAQAMWAEYTNGS